MHELSMASGVVEYALSEASRQKAKKVTEIDLEVGELSQVDVGAFSEALSLLLSGPVLKGCNVKVEVAKASFECRKCSSLFDMDVVRKELAGVSDDLLVREPDSKEVPLHFLPQLYSAFVRCPGCGSSDVTVTSGEDIHVTRLGLE